MQDTSYIEKWLREVVLFTYQATHLEEDDVNFLYDVCDKWIFEKRTDIPEHYDRYLIIDNKK